MSAIGESFDSGVQMKTSHGKILSPRDGEYVGSQIPIQGVASTIPFDKDIWIVHRRVRNGAYWPKEPKVATTSDNRFDIKVYEDGAPGRIIISLILVDKTIGKKFENWLESGHRTGSYPEIEPDKYAVEELTSVEVIYEKDRPLRIFYSYAHEDESLRASLEKHLTMLKRNGYIEQWHDRRITAGTNLLEKISSEIERANVILFLVSSSFVASEYCYQIEMKRALERHEKGEARVVPIIVRSVDWSDAPFAHLLSLPKDGYPVTSWANQDEAWTDVAKGIRKVIEEIR